MPVAREIGVGVVGMVLMLVITACGPAPANAAPPVSSNQTPMTVPATTTLQQASDVVWGRVPYCNCLATSATANVAGALKAANLTVTLQELSPQDGWLYFAVTFDPHSTTWEQVDAAMKAGGAEVLDGPP